MGDARPGLDQPSQLAVGEVDGVRQHRPFAEPAGPVVDVDVVERLGEEPRDLGDLARILGHVGLPPRPGRARQRRGLAEQSAEQEMANRGVTA